VRHISLRLRHEKVKIPFATLGGGDNACGHKGPPIVIVDSEISGRKIHDALKDGQFARTEGFIHVRITDRLD
jgi:hypothetical protein